MQDHPPSSVSPSTAHEAETWQVYWKEQGQPWRSEPLIDEERQQRLSVCTQGEIDIEQGKYPFKGMCLSRADVEWLLAAVEQGSAEVRTGGGDGRKPHGLDVRGADLSGVDLSHLPLVRLRAGLSLEEGRHATVEQSRQAAANLAKADLSYAQLQGAQFGWATLDEAVLVEAHLEGADLGKASLKHVMSLCLRKGGARADNGDQHDANFRDYIRFTSTSTVRAGAASAPATRPAGRPWSPICSRLNINRPPALGRDKRWMREGVGALWSIHLT